MNKRGNKFFKNITLFSVGMIVLIFGVALIFLWWPNLVEVVKGLAGIVLALAGLVMLYLAR